MARERTADAMLSQSVTQVLATVKEKLIELRSSLEGEVEQAKIDKHINEINESVKLGLGLSDD